MVLPEGFALPPLLYVIGLLAAVGGVGYALYRRAPRVDDQHVLGLAPWMAVGSCLHVHYVIGSLPAALAPLAGTPAVYVTVAALAGGVWLAADQAVASPGESAVPAALFGVGVALLMPVVAAALWVGRTDGGLVLAWPVGALVASLPLTAALWLGLRTVNDSVRVTGAVGLLAVFGHVLDGVSTAVGIDVLGFGERSPLSRLVFEAAGRLPTADLLGTGWLFVVVKAALAGFIVSLFVEFVEEDPTQGYLLLGFIAAVGLGPGVHNLLLFVVAG